MTPAQTPLTGQHILKGLPAAAQTARLLTTALLPPRHPALDDTRLVVSELVTNAIQHTYSGLPGGELGLSVDPHHPQGVLVEVVDAGGSTTPTMAALNRMSPHGHGLRLVDALTVEWGTSPLPAGYRTVWAVVGGDAA